MLQVDLDFNASTLQYPPFRCSGHLDGSIWRFTFPAEEGSGGLGHVQLTTHSCVPYCLGWGNAIAAAGNDNRVGAAVQQECL